MKRTRLILLMSITMLCFTSATGQVRRQPLSAQNKKKPRVSTYKAPLVKPPLTGTDQFKAFWQLMAQANVVFNFPKGFKEVTAPNDEDFSYDYALELPGQDFEVWFQVKSQKENYASYLAARDDNDHRVENPDSLYLNMGTAQATAFSGDKNYFVRSMPQNVLTRYNADAGKSYLINLLDLPATKHYKYALLITLQRNHTGTIIAVCFTNEKGPEFFKNIDKVSNCVKFKS